MATPNTWTLDGRTTEFLTDFGIWSTGYARVELDAVDITGTVQVDGVEDGSTSVKVTVPLATVTGNVGATLKVSRVDYVDDASPSDSLISDIGRVPGTIDPIGLHAELIHMLQLIGDTTGGVDTSYADDAKAWARLKTIAELLFTTPNYSDGGSLYWDGTGTGDIMADYLSRIAAIEAWDTDDLPNASSVVPTSPLANTASGALDELEDRIDAQGTQIQSGVGLPTPVDNGEWLKGGLGNSTSWEPITGADVGITDAGAHYTGTDVEAALQEAGADIDTNTTDIGTNTTDIGTNTTNISNLDSAAVKKAATATITALHTFNTKPQNSSSKRALFLDDFDDIQAIGTFSAASPSSWEDMGSVTLAAGTWLLAFIGEMELTTVQSVLVGWSTTNNSWSHSGGVRGSYYNDSGSTRTQSITAADFVNGGSTYYINGYFSSTAANNQLLNGVAIAFRISD